MVRRLECMDRVLSLYDQNLTTSQDADNLALNALPPAIRQILTQLAKTRGEISTEASIVGQRLHNIDSWIIQIETAFKVLQEVFRHLANNWTTNRQQARTYTRRSNLRCKSKTTRRADETGNVDAKSRRPKGASRT